MKIRTQLIAAFLLLAVVPLTAIVVWSAWSSLSAVRRAVEAESAELAGQMEERTALIKDDLRRRVESLGRLPLAELYRPGDGEERTVELSEGSRRMLKRTLEEIEEAGPLLESFVFVPLSPTPPVPPIPPSVDRPPRPPEEPSVRLEALRVDLGELRRRLEAAGQLEPSSREIEELEDIEGMEGIEGIEGNEQTRAILEKAIDFSLMVAEISADEAVERFEMRVEELEKAEELEAWHEERRAQHEILGRDFDAEVRDQGRLVGEVQARINAKELLQRVLASAPRDRGELPFALDAQGNLHAEDADRRVLDDLELELDSESGCAHSRREPGDWVIVSQTDPDSGLVLGVARPIGHSLAEIRNAAITNLGAGMVLIGLALLGILPFSARISRGVEAVTRGADQIAGGDLTARVPVEGSGEVGRLARAFNHMAEELSEHQERLLTQERQRREQELEKRLLEERFAHKSSELEDARQFQLALLPKSLPLHPAYELAVDMRTATEVGGDYYDLHLTDDGILTVAVGDATGHGARAGTMVTVIKTLFSAAGAELPPEVFLERASATIRGLRLERMLMGLTLARIENGSLLLSAAGMPPVLVHRAARGHVDEISMPGMPLGGLECAYETRRADLSPGDTLLFVSDGLPELLGQDGEPFGYERLQRRFAAAASGSPKEIVAGLERAATQWSNGRALEDDMTFVVVRCVET